MFSNYIKIALRNLSKNLRFTFINVLSMAMGIAPLSKI